MQSIQIRIFMIRCKIEEIRPWIQTHDHSNCWSGGESSWPDYTWKVSLALPQNFIQAIGDSAAGFTAGIRIKNNFSV